MKSKHSIEICNDFCFREESESKSSPQVSLPASLLWQLAPERRVPGEGPERSFSKRVPESVWEYLGSHAQAVDALDEAIYKE